MIYFIMTITLKNSNLSDPMKTKKKKGIHRISTLIPVSEAVFHRQKINTLLGRYY